MAEKRLSENCILCNAMTNAKSAAPTLYNTILFESENFLVTPCIGPLVARQLLISSKDHFQNLAQMGNDRIVEFHNLVLQLERAQKKAENYLLAEHGSFDDQTGGGCITHAHIHLIPGFAQYYDILDPLLSILDGDDNGTIHANLREPYIYTSNSERQSRIYSAYNGHSQMIRKALCSKLGRSDWNWRNDPKDELVKQTITFWQNGKF